MICRPRKARNGYVEYFCRAESVRGTFEIFEAVRDGGKYGFSLSLGVGCGVSSTGEGSTSCIEIRDGDLSWGRGGRFLSGIIGDADLISI